MNVENWARDRRVLIDYLKHKVDICDWHAVADAANDLRVLDAEHFAANYKKVGCSQFEWRSGDYCGRCGYHMSEHANS